MNTMPKGFYTDIRRQLQADTEELAARGILVDPDEIASEFRNRSARLQHATWQARRHKALVICRIWLGASGLILLLGAVGGISQGTMPALRGFLLALLGMGSFVFAGEWRGWRA